MTRGSLVLAVLPCAVMAPQAEAQTPSAAAPAQAADEKALRISGSFRARYETLQGQVRPGFNEREDIYGLRTTLLAEYHTGPIRLGAELYDSRVYGADHDSPVSANDVNAAELVQAYVAADIAAPFGKGSSLAVQAGRFTMNLGSRRLVAADDYRNTTNGFTGIRADVASGAGTSATFFYVLPQVRLPDDMPSVLDNRQAFDRESFALQLWGALISRPILGNGIMGEVSYFGLHERDTGRGPTRDRDLHSFGARLIREPAPERMDFEVEAIAQRGTVSAGLSASAPRQKVKAGFVHLEAGYSLRGPWKPRLSLEYEYASGDGPGSRFGRFDTLYGSRRADLGPSGIYAAIGRANISTPAVRLELVPGKRTDVFAAYRLMWAAEGRDAFSTSGVRDPSGASGRFAGQQIEGRVRHWLVPKRLRGEVNALWLIKGRLLDEAPNATMTGNSFYLSLAGTVSF